MGATRHPPEIIDAILAAWRGGASYPQMAKDFETSINVVAGIVYRNRAPGEESARPFFQESSEARERPVLPAMCLQRSSAGGHMPTGRTVTHMAKMASGFRPKTCQFFEGAPGPDFWKCGKPTAGSTAYCEPHYRRCHIFGGQPNETA
jgi:hypothetical protein